MTCWHAEWQDAIARGRHFGALAAVVAEAQERLDARVKAIDALKGPLAAEDASIEDMKALLLIMTQWKSHTVLVTGLNCCCGCLSGAGQGGEGS